MSTRTIIEINHDQLRELLSDVTRTDGKFALFIFDLAGTDITKRLNAGESPIMPAPGVRVLAQRNHTEPLVIELPHRKRRF